MKRELILTLALILTSSQAYCYDLFLPKEKKSNVKTNYAFFVGKAQNSETMTINDEKIYIAPNGAFVYSVKLKDGENRIVVKSNFNTQIYKFYKEQNSINNSECILNEFETAKKYIVKKDNTPLRNTPIDAGMNRISHLFKGTELVIDAEKASFYRVVLSKNDFAWIAKKDVEQMCDNTFFPAKFISMDGENYKNATIKSIEFSKKLPYTIKELNDEIIFKIYNPELSEDSVYTINIPKPLKYTYKITLNDGKYLFKINELPTKISDYVITVDAGHGGAERGAIGCLGDEEKNINLKIALELKEQLKALGFSVIMTRECDGNMTLDERVDLAKQNNSNIFVSIHLNSIGDVPMNLHKHRGTEIYYFNPNSKELAEALEKSIAKEASTKKSGVHAASFAVIRPVEYIGVLVEAAYMTNPNDSVLYTSDDFACNVAKGIADGILEFVNK